MLLQKAKILDSILSRPIAHRGLHSGTIIENSLQAAQAAITHQYGIECDVQRTRNNEAVVFHDFNLHRLTGQTGNVQDYTAFELSSFHIMSLSDFINFIAGRVPIIIEIKSRFDGDMSLIRCIAETIKDYNAPVAIKSFDPACVAELKRIAPHIVRGIVGMSAYKGGEFVALLSKEKQALAQCAHFNETQPDFVSWNLNDLSTVKAKMPQIPLITWTVRSKSDMDKALLYADQIIFEGFMP